ncbi:Crp/Fnr family transcriptional regulator [Amorphus sp. 3PC139-8]|uniref:Crp/Fnr family transcriptional regulator n=1 Tax=Amorphus sp. 3PC139-8 TaxID=2735676 RepID=UPI00345DA370
MREPHFLDRAFLDAGGVPHCAERGRVAFAWAGRPEAFVFLRRGQLSVRFRTKGRTVPWAECRTSGQQDCMPITAAILSGAAFSARATCLAPSSWIELDPNIFVRLIHEHPNVRGAIFASHAHRLPAFFARLSADAAIGFDGRLSDWLLAHAQAGAMVATHREIADDLVTAREVVSRRLKVFAERGWIVQERGRILISAPAALSRLSRGSFTSRHAQKLPPQHA